MLGFQINPPRNNGSIGYFGAALGQMIWLARNDKPIGLRGALLAQREDLSGVSPVAEFVVESVRWTA